MYSLPTKEHPDIFDIDAEVIVRALYGLVRKDSYRFSLDDCIEMKLIPCNTENDVVEIVAKGVYYDMTYGGLYLRYDDKSKRDEWSMESFAYINFNGRLYKDGDLIFRNKVYTVEGDGLSELYSRVKQYAENANMRVENIKAIKKLIEEEGFVRLDLLPVNITDFDENGKPINIEGIIEGMSYTNDQFNDLNKAPCAIIRVDHIDHKTIEYPLYYMRDLDIMHIRSSMFDIVKREERDSIVCLPTEEQFRELIDSCQWFLNKDKKGYDIISPNGNSIFLPALGYKWDDDIVVRDGGSGGYYWSSTERSSSDGYSLYFGSGGLRTSANYKSSNYFPVRLVQASGFNSKMKGFVDLGLPSGTKWARNNASKKYMNWNEAMDFVKKLNVKLNKDAGRGLSF